MQKTKHLFNHRVPHKKGFALIITLSALAVIIALTVVLISYMDEARRDSSRTKAMIQGNLYYADIKKIFSKFKKKKILYTTLYLTPVPFASPDGRFSVLLRCTPLANGVNINWLGLGNRQKMSEQFSMVQDLFESIVQEYDLEDGTRLEEIILEEIGGKEKFVQKEQSRLRQKNGIISFKQFEGILDKYQLEVDDSKIGNVPWKKFFVFNKVEKIAAENVIDGNYISAELISFLFAMDLSTVKEEWIAGQIDLKTFIQDNGSSYNQKLFEKDFLEQSQCDVQYAYEGDRYAFKFEDIEGEVKNFEFFGK